MLHPLNGAEDAHISYNLSRYIPLIYTGMFNTDRLFQFIGCKQSSHAIVFHSYRQFEGIAFTGNTSCNHAQYREIKF